MTDRIQPTHFIELWKWPEDKYTGMNKKPEPIKDLFLTIGDTYVKTIALFLIRAKTKQEQANSIYYPLNKQV